MHTTRSRVAGLFFALAFVAIAGCGGSQVVTSAPRTTPGPPAPTGSWPATRATVPTRSTLPTPATGSPTTFPGPPTTPPSVPSRDVALGRLVPPASVLGPEWENDGDQATSLDLTDPPPQCDPFLAVVHSRTETLIHEYSFGVSPDGNLEQGHFNFAAMRAPSPQLVSLVLAAVARPAFAACAEANAVRWFDDTQEGVTIDSVSARIIELPVPGRSVIWRVTIENHSTRGASHPMYMDVVHLGGGDVLVKVRIWSCGCTPPASSDGELLPGEIDALGTTAQVLEPPVVTG